jgi:branched-chain amino acid transport system ATP-binding protein
MVCPSGLAGAFAHLRNRLLRPWIAREPAPASSVAGAPSEPPPVSVRAVGPGAGNGSAGVVPTLRVRGLRVCIGEAVIVDDIDLDVLPGSTLALLGTNGAGKSTILNAISGVLPVAAGTVELDGTDITNLAPHRIAALGVGQAPGGRGVFPSLTVAENLDVAAWTHRRGDAAVARRADAALEAFPQLRRRVGEHAANLSGGEQQMLVMAMASVADPALLLIDELSLGLAPIVVEQLLRFLEQIRAQGTTVVVVEQSLGTALAITDSAMFLERGRVAFVGPTAELQERPDLARSIYLAGAGVGVSAAAAPADPVPTRPDGIASGHDTALAAHGVSVHYGGVSALSDVDLTVRVGETVGLIGPNGAGKSSLLDALCGLLPLRTGRVEVAGRDVTSASYARRARDGLGRSFQHAELFPSLTVEETLAIACDRSVTAPGVADAVLCTPAERASERAVRARVAELLERFGLGSQREQRVGELSTGQRRVVDLAALVADRPQVLLLDEPSSGLAQAEVAALGDLLRRMRRELDLTLIVVEHDIPLVSGLADRLVALDQGRVIAAGPPEVVLADALVVSSYLGVDWAERNAQVVGTAPA